MLQAVPAAVSGGTVQPLPLTAEAFAETYAPRVHRFAAMITRSDQDSSDLAQEALLRALRGLDRFDAGKGTLEAWVWRIVINTARDAGRVRRRRALLQERWNRFAATREPESVEATTFEHLRDADVLDAVRRLPERSRTMIALRFGAQLGTTEIAQQMKMQPSAVTMAITRALGRLRAGLEEWR